MSHSKVEGWMKTIKTEPIIVYNKAMIETVTTSLMKNSLMKSSPNHISLKVPK